MKFTVTFKTPDALENAVDEEVSYFQGFKNGDTAESVKDELMSFAKQWVKWSEYITVEFDTQAGTCTVLKARN